MFPNQEHNGKKIIFEKNREYGGVTMDLIQIKIEKDDSIARYIKLIREFDSSLSVSAIKQRIENNDFVTGFDLEYYDAVEDLTGVDRKRGFRDMIDSLIKAGAQVSVWQDGELSSMQFLDNWLETLDEISRQTESDMDDGQYF